MKELKLYVIKYNNGDVDEWEEDVRRLGIGAEARSCKSPS